MSQQAAIGQYLEGSEGQPQASALRLVKNTLNGGELSPELGGRFDQQRYNTGCEICENMIPLPQGGVMRRPPLRSLALCAGYATRLERFEFSSSDVYLLEFYEGETTGVGLRVWRSATEFYNTTLYAPWPKGILKDVCFCQSADVIYCAHPSIAPCKISRHSHTDWRYSKINWLPETPSPAWAELHPYGPEPSGESEQAHYYRVTAINAETGEESLPNRIGGYMAYPLSQSYFMKIRIVPVEGASEYRVYKKKGGVFGFIGRITEGDSFEDHNITPDTEDTPPDYRNPFEDGGNPSLVFLHQQRLGFASSNQRPLTFWLSRTGSHENMGASTPPNDDDAIEATLAAQDASRIVWAQSDRNGLAFGTEGGEWLLVASEGAAITPKDLSFQPQTFYGAQKGLKVLRAGDSLMFVQKNSHAVREFGYSFQEDRYRSGDLTLLARHMLKGRKIKSWTWQGEPHGIVWFVMNDGTLTALTYLREHDVIAWHRHVSQNAQIEQAVCVPSFINQNTLCLLVKRKNPSTGNVESWLEYLEDFDADFTQNYSDSNYNYPFTGKLAPCFGEVQTENGLSFALLKKINSLKCRVLASQPFRARVCGQSGQPSAWHTVPAKTIPETKGRFQDWHAPIQAGWRDNPKLEMEFPKPATLLCISIAAEFSDLLGNQ